MQLDQALRNGLFGLAHEALVADCCCLAVCCSDMRDYTMYSHRERRGRARARGERERRRGREREWEEGQVGG